MPIRQVAFAPLEFYHVYNRGTDKRTIFKDNSDYRRFIELLYLCNSQHPINVRDVRDVHEDVFEFERGDTLVSIGAYCLMSNHFHILLTPRVDDGLSIFMKKLGTGYSMYFNKRYERSGSLFEGRFKAKRADNDEYLKYLFSYIHLNPVKLIQPDWKERGIRDVAAALKYVSSFKYSSLSDYLGLDRKEKKLLTCDSFPEYFTNHDDIKEELFDWLDYQE